MAEPEEKPDELTEPSLLGEIGKLALLVGKLIGVVLAVIAVLAPIFWWSVVAGVCVSFGLYMAAMVVYMGYQNCKLKKLEVEWRRRDRADRLKWEAAEAKLRGDKTA